MRARFWIIASIIFSLLLVPLYPYRYTIIGEFRKQCGSSPYATRVQPDGTVETLYYYHCDTDPVGAIGMFGILVVVFGLMLVTSFEISWLIVRGKRT